MKTILATALVLAFTATAPAQQPFRLVSEKRHQELVSLIPKTDDPRLEKLISDNRLIVYTGLELPKASQFWDVNPLAGVHDARHNISANPQRRRDGGVSGGPGQEFPWRFPFGTDDAEGVQTLKFVWLPPGKAIRWWMQTLPPRDRYPTTRWLFPAGTVFGEVLTVHDPETGHNRPFELRVRKKSAGGTWQPNVYRPVVNRVELDKLVPELAGYSKQRQWTLRNQHPYQFVYLPAVEDVLPPLPAAKVRDLLSRPFRSVRGQEWVPGGFAPGTDASFHIVPKGYAGAAVSVDAHTCATCHKTTQMHPDDFGPPGRDWYGRVPGDDEAFSFHIFSQESVSGGGFLQPVRLNQKMVAAGILKHWDE